MIVIPIAIYHIISIHLYQQNYCRLVLGCAPLRDVSSLYIRPYLDYLHFVDFFKTSGAWGLARGLSCSVFPNSVITEAASLGQRGGDLNCPKGPGLCVPWPGSLGGMDK